MCDSHLERFHSAGAEQQRRDNTEEATEHKTISRLLFFEGSPSSPGTKLKLITALLQYAVCRIINWKLFKNRLPDATSKYSESVSVGWAWGSAFPRSTQLLQRFYSWAYNVSTQVRPLPIVSNRNFSLMTSYSLFELIFFFLISQLLLSVGDCQNIWATDPSFSSLHIEHFWVSSPWWWWLKWQQPLENSSSSGFMALSMPPIWWSALFCTWQLMSLPYILKSKRIISSGVSQSWRTGTMPYTTVNQYIINHWLNGSINIFNIILVLHG